MITSEQFASIEVGDEVTVRREMTGKVVRCDGGYMTIDTEDGKFTPGSDWWTLVEHTKPTPEWHRAKVIAATYGGEGLGYRYVFIAAGAGTLWSRPGSTKFIHPEHLSDVRVLVGEDEEL